MNCQIEYVSSDSDNGTPCGKPAVTKCADCGSSICSDCSFECCGDSFCEPCYDYLGIIKRRPKYLSNALPNSIQDFELIIRFQTSEMRRPSNGRKYR